MVACLPSKQKVFSRFDSGHLLKSENNLHNVSRWRWKIPNKKTVQGE